MSNRRKLKRPKHVCDDREFTIHFCGDPDCPGDDCPNTELDMHMCGMAYAQALEAVGLGGTDPLRPATGRCPCCGEQALDIRTSPQGRPS